MKSDIRIADPKALPSGISLEILDSFEKMKRFFEEWDTFWKNNKYRHPFNSPGWLLPWWEHFKNGEPLILVIRKDGVLIACIPLYIFISEENERQLKLIGTGNSDYLDILLAEGYEIEAGQVMNIFLEEIRQLYDICELHGQRENSMFLNGFADNSEFLKEVYSSVSSPVLVLPDNFEDYKWGISVRLKKNTQRAIKKLQSMDYQLEKADEKTFPLFFQALIKLHQQEWLSKGDKGVLSDNKVQEFLEEAAKKLLENNLVNIYALKSGNDFAAVNLIFETGNAAWYYIGGFEPKLNKYSPGSVLLWFIIEDCIKRGIRNFDFLSGAENYKYRWGANDVPIYRIILK